MASKVVQAGGRLRLLQLGGEGMEIVPECDDLGRFGRRQQFDFSKRQYLSTQLRGAEHLAVMRGDVGWRERAEAGWLLLA